jgi:hypothetical protein
MEIKKFTVGSNEYSFVCEGWSNSNGWGHRVVLIKNMYTMCEAKIKYINRTWENYQYQSCMLKAISIVEENKQELELECYKAKTGRKRLREAEKEEIYNNCDQLKELQELKTRVRGRIW